MSKVAKALGFERYVVLMLSLCGFNAFLVVLMWVLSGFNVVFMWFLCCFDVVLIWCLCGFNVGFMWFNV